MATGGHIALAEGGQFTLVSGGQFEWFFHPERILLIVVYLRKYRKQSLFGCIQNDKWPAKILAGHLICIPSKSAWLVPD